MSSHAAKAPHAGFFARYTLFRLPRTRAGTEPPLSHDDPSSIAPPEAIGPYRVLHQIGSGVLGPVFRAVDPDGDRIVAIKLFRLDWPPEQARALAGALQTLIETLPDHESLVRPLASGLEAGSAWLAQDFVGADGLEARLRRRTPLHADEAIRLLRQVATALDVAAAAGWRHGALHPRDILVDTSGRVRVTGVGVAQVVERFGARTPRRRPYTAPERAVAAGWDTRADVFALATIASEMLGPRRSRGQSDDLRVGAFTEAGFDGRRAIAALNRGMSNVAGERPPDATSLVDALEEAVGAPQEDAPVGVPSAASQSPAVPSTPLFDIAESEPTREPVSERPAEAPVIVHLPAEGAHTDALDAFDASATPESEQGGAGAREWELPIVGQTAAALPEPEPADRDVASPVRTHVWEPGPDPDVPDAAPSAAPEAPSSDDRRALSWGLLAAMLVAGLAVGFVAGRWSASPSPSVDSSSPATPVQRAEVKDEPVLGGEPPVPEGAPASATPPAAVAPSPKPSTAPPPARPTPAARQPERQSPPARARGRLLVRTSPAGARVKIDGKDRGVTPLALRDLDVGTLTVEVARAGYAPESRRVQLTERRPSQTLELRLRSTAPTPPGGTASSASPTGRTSLELASLPTGARAFVDGQPVGTTPLRLVDVVPGQKTIRFELPGHANWTTTVTLAPGEARRVAASLEPDR